MHYIMLWNIEPLSIPLQIPNLTKGGALQSDECHGLMLAYVNGVD